MMDHYSKNPTKILSILSLMVAAIILISCWEPLTYKNSFFPQNSVEKKDELDLALEKASSNDKTVIIAVINEAYVEPNNDEYPSMFDLFLEGFWVGEETRPLLSRLLVVSMDSVAHERCRFRRLNCYRLAAEGGGGDGFAGEKVYMSPEFIEMMWRRTFFLLQVLKRGYSFIFTDADILWLRNPFPRLINNESIDLHISTDVFNGKPSSTKNPINTGFYFIKSNNKTISLFQKWYDTRKNSPGMKEQDVLVKLVRQRVLKELDINTIFLDTLYFSGFCKDSHDVRSVVTVHANCCQSIRAKIADLKAVLRDWKRFKNKEIVGDGLPRNSTNNKFTWSKHISCWNSWHQ